MKNRARESRSKLPGAFLAIRRNSNRGIREAGSPGSQAAGGPRRGNRLPEPGDDPGKPAWGSQDWAETMGDDIPSDDQPGDDFDTEDTRGCE
jgi:hypothetical protein